MGGSEGYEGNKGALIQVESPPSSNSTMDVAADIDLNRVLIFADAVDLDPTLDFAAGTIAGVFNSPVSMSFEHVNHGRCS